jgi:hypothetical protein
MGMPPPSLEHWKSYCIFTTGIWFKRLWIVQEVGLARHARMLCGEQEVSWADVELIAKFVTRGMRRTDFIVTYSLTMENNVPTKDIFQLYNVRYLRLFDHPALRPSSADYFFRSCGASTMKQFQCAYLLDMWTRVFDKEKTNSRDNIFALLGLVSRFLPESGSCFCCAQQTGKCH